MALNCDGAAVLSYGAKLRVKDPATNTKIDVGGLTDFNGPQTSRGEIETTTLCSTSKEYALDLKDNGTFKSIIVLPRGTNEALSQEELAAARDLGRGQEGVGQGCRWSHRRNR